MDVISDLFENFSTLVLGMVGIVCLAMFISFSMMIGNNYKTRQAVENAVTDLLSYGAFHSGFNDGYDGSYSFSQELQRILNRHGLVQGQNIQNISYGPTGGYLDHRLKDITVSITPIYSSFNIFKPTEKKVGKAIIGRSKTHSFVKNYRTARG